VILEKVICPVVAAQMVKVVRDIDLLECGFKLVILYFTFSVCEYRR